MAACTNYQLVTQVELWLVRLVSKSLINRRLQDQDFISSCNHHQDYQILFYKLLLSACDVVILQRRWWIIKRLLSSRRAGEEAAAGRISLSLRRHVRADSFKKESNEVTAPPFLPLSSPLWRFSTPATWISRSKTGSQQGRSLSHSPSSAAAADTMRFSANSYCAKQMGRDRKKARCLVFFLSLEEEDAICGSWSTSSLNHQLTDAHLFH